MCRNIYYLSIFVKCNHFTPLRVYTNAYFINYVKIYFMIIINDFLEAKESEIWHFISFKSQLVCRHYLGHTS